VGDDAESRLVAAVCLQTKTDEQIEAVMMSLQTDQDGAVQVVNNLTGQAHWRARWPWDQWNVPQRRGGSRIGGPIGNGTIGGSHR
jgi:hypothetical protein